MYGRYDAVDKAHYETFQWFFNDDPQAEQDDARRLAKKSFMDWLSSGNGIFHISRKLGSGKSTLMKFLYQHDRTKTELKK
jgi:hypothetical protein